MKKSFSIFQWFRRVLMASLAGGGVAVLVQEWTEYQMLGHVSLTPADAEALRQLLSAPAMTDDSIAIAVAILFGAYKALRNYARNHPDAADWLKSVFGDASIR